LDGVKDSDKYEKIRDINSQGRTVKHVIVRHGMTDDVAFEVESALIDLANTTGARLTNMMSGHHSIEKGLMSSAEIARKYNAKPLNELSDNAVIININRRYKRFKQQMINGLLSNEKDLVYEAIKEAWVISKHRRQSLDYVLAEYKGLIVEVYKILEKKNTDGQIKKWYPVKTNDKTCNRWGFYGERACDEIRNKYINRSISHLKSKGAANPIRYNL